MRVLVAYATKKGSTGGIAETIGEELRRMGLETDVRPIAEVQDVRAYEAVILGSAIYFGRWRKETLTLRIYPNVGRPSCLRWARPLTNNEHVAGCVAYKAT